MSEEKEYRKAIIVAASLQVPLTLMLALVCDGGQIFQFWIVTLTAFWLGYGIIKWRRPDNPTKGDLFCVRWGIVPLMILVPFIMMTIWKMKGLPLE